jgi:hypothetical protein
MAQLWFSWALSGCFRCSGVTGCSRPGIWRPFLGLSPWLSPTFSVEISCQPAAVLRSTQRFASDCLGIKQPRSRIAPFSFCTIGDRLLLAVFIGCRWSHPNMLRSSAVDCLKTGSVFCASSGLLSKVHDVMVAWKLCHVRGCH